MAPGRPGGISQRFRQPNKLLCILTKFRRQRLCMEVFFGENHRAGSNKCYRRLNGLFRILESRAFKLKYKKFSTEHLWGSERRNFPKIFDPKFN